MINIFFQKINILKYSHVWSSLWYHPCAYTCYKKLYFFTLKHTRWPSNLFRKSAKSHIIQNVSTRCIFCFHIKTYPITQQSLNIFVWVVNECSWGAPQIKIILQHVGRHNKFRESFFKVSILPFSQHPCTTSLVIITYNTIYKEQCQYLDENLFRSCALIISYSKIFFDGCNHMSVRTKIVDNIIWCR